MQIFTQEVKRLLFSVIIIGCTSGSIFGQEQDSISTAADPVSVSKPDNRSKAKGIVRDATTNKPLSAISISIPGYSASITDEKGEFTISVPGPSTTIFISGEGYQNKEVLVRDARKIEVHLYERGYNSFYSTVTMPFGKKSKVRIPYAVNSINTEDSWQRTSSESADNYLQGRMPGVNVVRRSGTPGAGGNIYLRGFTSLYATNQPLIVVDGMIYDNNSGGTSLIAGHSNNPLSHIDLKDVDSYTVIKDGSSLYGTRAANGLILITTNRAKSQTTAIDFAAYGGFNNQVSSIPVMQSAQYRTYLSDLLKTVPGLTDDSIRAKPYMNDDNNPASLGYNAQYYRYHNETDWQKEVLQNSYNQNYYLKVTGGDNIATYGLSVGYLKNGSITDNTDLQRLQTRFNADLKLSTRLTGFANLSYVDAQQNLRDQGVAVKTNPLFLALVKAPFLYPHEVGEDGGVSPNFSERDVFNTSNPSALIENMQAINKNYRFTGSAGFNFKVTNSLKAQTLFGVTFDKGRENTFVPKLGVVPDTTLQSVVTNRSGTSTQRFYSMYSDTWLSYVKSFNRVHDLSINAGLRYNKSQMEVDYGQGFNSATDDYVSVTSGLPSLRRVGGTNGKWNWMNVYANADYSMYDKYFASVNLAVDGSSRFGKDADGLKFNGNRYAVLPSVAVAWLMSSEGFMSDVKTINSLKLRASYGITGNDDLGNYTSRRYYVPQNFLGSDGLVIGNVPDYKLKWETIAKSNVGLDVSFADERLNLTIDYFNNKTTNMISLQQLSFITGLPAAVSNNSSMKTSGIELCVDGRVLNGSLKWDMGVNLSTYKNKLLSIPDNGIFTSYAGATIASTAGRPANLFYGFRTTGVYSSDSEAAATNLVNRRADGTETAFRGGDVKFADLNSDGFIDDNDREFIGDPNPELTGGINNAFSWKRWSADALFTFSLGNDIYNYTRRSLESMDDYSNQTLVVLNRWKAQGQVTNTPRAEMGDPAGNSRFSDRWIENGSYFRLRTVSLAYDIPMKAKGIKSTKIYLTANNLFTLTSYLGYDPEFSASGSVFSQGVDVGLEPQFRTIQLGVRVGL